MLVAADAMQESDDTRNQKMGELLRLYVDIQTYVRTSQPIPLSMGERYNELQNEFNTKATRRIDEDNDYYGSEYFKPLGIYYLGLRCSLAHIDANPNMVSQEPVRELEVRACYSGEAFARLLRNYRMDYMQRVTFRFERGYRTNRPGNVVEIAQAVLNMKAAMMESIRFVGVNDNLKKIQVMFASARGIRKGCRLSINRQTYGSEERADWTLVKK